MKTVFPKESYIIHLIIYPEILPLLGGDFLFVI